MSNLLLLSISFTALFFFPGLLIAAWASNPRKEIDLLSFLTMTLGATFVFMPAIIFLASVLTLEPVSLTQAAVPAAGVVLLLRKRFSEAITLLRTAWKTSPLNQWSMWIPIPLVFIHQFLTFDTAHTFHLWCTYMPCAIGAGLPIGPEAGDLNPLLFFSGHQRMGITALLTPLFGIHGLLGLRLQWAGIFAVIAGTIQVIAVRIGVRPQAAAAAALIAGLAPGIAMEADQNRVMLALSGFGILLILNSIHRPFLLGLVGSFSLGCEPVVILGLPAAFVALWSAAPRTRRLAFFLRLFAGILIGALPFMLHYHLAFGSPLFHEHFSYIPLIDYSVFGFRFQLPAFLNWPLAEHLVRSKYNPLPNLAILPLTLGLHFGLLLLSVTFFGLFALLFRRRWNILLPTALFAFPLLIFLALNENWTQLDKRGIAIMAYFPLFLWMAWGVDQLIEARGFRLVRSIGALALLLCLSTVSHFALNRIQAPEDERFKQTWEKDSIIPMSPEDSTLMKVEADLSRRLHWLPGYRSTKEIVIPYQFRRNIFLLLEELSNRSVFDRTYSITERCLAMISQENEFGWFPVLVDSEEERKRHCLWPVEAILNLKKEPSAVLNLPGQETIRSWVKGSENFPGLHLHPYNDPVLVEVPWKATPVKLALILDGQETAAYLIYMRYNQDRPNPRDNVLDGKNDIALHLPPGIPLYIIDMLASDPVRTYTYRLQQNEEKGWQVRMMTR